MKRLSLACLVVLTLAGCGANPAPLSMPVAAYGPVETRQNLVQHKDLRTLCKYVVKNQTKAKPNKTNVARLWVALDYAQGLAEKEGNQQAIEIAAAALERHHKRSAEVKGNLPTAVATEMKADLLDAFNQILATFEK